MKLTANEKKAAKVTRPVFQFLGALAASSTVWLVVLVILTIIGW